MENNKGFTIVEFIVSFALTMIIVLFLFQIVLTLKQVYLNNYIVSDLVLKQANISEMINNDLLTNNLGNVTAIGTVSATGEDINNKCYNISFQYGVRKLCYNKNDNTVTYNDYEFELIKNSKLDDVSAKMENNILKIKIPITYPDIDDNFDIKIAYF